MSCSVCIHDNLNYIIHDKLYSIIKLPVVFLIHKMLAIFIYVAFHDPLRLFCTIHLCPIIAGRHLDIELYYRYNIPTKSSLILSLSYLYLYLTFILSLSYLILSLSYIYVIFMLSLCPSPDCCDKLFEQFNSFADSAKRKAAVWPLEMMLLVLCPVSGYCSAIWCHNSQTGCSGKKT